MRKLFLTIFAGLLLAALPGCAALEKLDVGNWITTHASAIGNLFSSSGASDASDASGASGKTTENSAK